MIYEKTKQLRKRKILKQRKFFLPIKSSIRYNLNQSGSSFLSRNVVGIWFGLTEGYNLED